MYCFFCHYQIDLMDRVGREERCPHCNRDLHICRNCQYYDSNAYNECREPQAERVLDKESSNFCDYFSPSDRTHGSKVEDPAAEAKKKLEGLFKK